MCDYYSVHMYNIYYDKQEFDSAPLGFPSAHLQTACKPPLYQPKQANAS